MRCFVNIHAYNVQQSSILRVRERFITEKVFFFKKQVAQQKLHVLARVLVGGIVQRNRGAEEALEKDTSN